MSPAEKHPRSRSRVRATVYLAALVVVALDAAIATPIGLPLLYVIPVAWAGWWLGRGETVVLAILCALARVVFGVEADLPWLPTRAALEVSAQVETALRAVTSLVGYVGLGWLIATMTHQRRELGVLRVAAEEDPLTGLANRRRFERFLRDQRSRTAAVVAIDLDRFKSINDTRGHAAGDAILVELAARLRTTVRAEDLLARIGGEEFVLILLGAPRDVAQRVGEEICEAVRARPFAPPGGPLAVTASVGAALGALGPELVAAADAALYRAKDAGRDRLVLAETEPDVVLER